MAIRIETGVLIAFRPTEYDTDVLKDIQAKNPHIPDATGLIREALHRWDIDANDENSKTKRLDRIEHRLEEIDRKLTDFIEASNK